MRCALTGKLKFGFFMMGKRLRTAYFPAKVFSYSRCISATSRKRIEQLLHQSLEPTLSVYKVRIRPFIYELLVLTLLRTRSSGIPTAFVYILYQLLSPLHISVSAYRILISTFTHTKSFGSVMCVNCLRTSSSTY